MGVQIDAPEVDDPEELGQLRYHDLVGGASRREGQPYGLYPLGPLGRCALLEEEVASRPVNVTLQDYRSVVDAA